VSGRAGTRGSWATAPHHLKLEITQPLRVSSAATGLVHDFAHEIKPFDKAGSIMSARPLQIFLGIFKSDFGYMQANLNRK
jgi:hypothetical protein